MRPVRLRWLALPLALALVGAFIAISYHPHASRSVHEAAAEHPGEGPTDINALRELGGLHGVGPTAGQLAAIGAQAHAVQTQTRRSKPRLTRPGWHFIGPSNIGGRVTDIVADPKVKNQIFVASASGGVWKSTDGGMNYTSIWPISYPQSIGAMVMGSDGTLWVGTGEANPGGGSVTYGGDGVYTSTDRGAHWKNVGLAGSLDIGRIAVDPGNPKHVLVAVTGNLYRPGGMRGLYQTHDGGHTWKRAFAPPNKTTGAVDVQFDPKQPKTILVAMWDRIRYPDVRYYTGPGSGMWRSTDGGKTFTQLGAPNGLPPANSQIGRIGVAFDPEDPTRAYAMYANNQEGSSEAMFASVDSGAHWVGMPGSATLGASQSVYGWWFGRLYVDPHDSNHLYVTGLMLYQSINAGSSFTPDSELHADHHAVAFDPFNPTRVWDGSDGGVYVSTTNDPAQGHINWTHANRQPWMQFFRIDVSAQDPSHISGGMQDNGDTRSWPNPKWNQYYDSDGVENVINPTDVKNVFACGQYGDCARSDDGGTTMTSMNNTHARDGWLTPISFQPGSGSVMYWAGDVVQRSTDRGNNWTTISPDLGKGNAGRETNPLYANHYGTVQALGLNKKDPKTIYAGTDEGYLWKTTNTGGAWKQLTSKALPNRWITDIAVRLNNPNQLYVSFSGYRQGDHAAYVVRSFDGGKTWKNVSANLPHAPVNEVVLDGSRLFVATDVGVYTSSAGHVHWYSLGHGLPNSPVNDLRYIGKTHTLYGGTFGHGIWSIKVPR